MCDSVLYVNSTCEESFLFFFEEGLNSLYIHDLLNILGNLLMLLKHFSVALQQGVTPLLNLTCCFNLACL